ncbi:hypothetical protein WJX73_005928 [Symbiochloris irregularis]|uniref:50S ribosomal protein L33, chloroplastic n=1 Tax=Symbiochloris irregularis TaxID=706552 RepID=A0AAW1PQ91_9CHLO
MQLRSLFFGNTLKASVQTLPAPSSQGCRSVTTCMAKKKGIRCIVTLECTEARKLGLTPSRYTTQKNRRNTAGRMELLKYNKFLKRHTLHREIK